VITSAFVKSAYHGAPEHADFIEAEWIKTAGGSGQGRPRG
jgi:hypothetical protein